MTFSRSRPGQELCRETACDVALSRLKVLTSRVQERKTRNLELVYIYIYIPL